MQPFTLEQFNRLLDFVSTVIDFPGYRALVVPEGNKPLIEWFYNHPLFQRFYPKALNPDHACWDSRTPCGWLTQLHSSELWLAVHHIRYPFPRMCFDRDLSRTEAMIAQGMVEFLHPVTKYPMSSLDDRLLGTSITSGTARVLRGTYGYRLSEFKLDP